jgi:hypothetical protein
MTGKIDFKKTIDSYHAQRGDFLSILTAFDHNAVWRSDDPGGGAAGDVVAETAEEDAGGLGCHRSVRVAAVPAACR